MNAGANSTVWVELYYNSVKAGKLFVFILCLCPNFADNLQKVDY